MDEEKHTKAWKSNLSESKFYTYVCMFFSHLVPSNSLQSYGHNRRLKRRVLAEAPRQ